MSPNEKNIKGIGRGITLYPLPCNTMHGYVVIQPYLNGTVILFLDFLCSVLAY